MLTRNEKAVVFVAKLRKLGRVVRETDFAEHRATTRAHFRPRFAALTRGIPRARWKDIKF